MGGSNDAFEKNHIISHEVHFNYTQQNKRSDSLIQLLSTTHTFTCFLFTLSKHLKLLNIQYS